MYTSSKMVSTMRIIYTRHTQQRMAQRKVSPEQIEETLETPDEIVIGDQGEEIAIKQYGSREVRVVYEETETDTFVIYTVINSRIRRP
jgi:hypothetical protein